MSSSSCSSFRFGGAARIRRIGLLQPRSAAAAKSRWRQQREWRRSLARQVPGERARHLLGFRHARLSRSPEHAKLPGDDSFFLDKWISIRAQCPLQGRWISFQTRSKSSDIERVSFICSVVKTKELIPNKDCFELDSSRCSSRPAHPAGVGWNSHPLLPLLITAEEACSLLRHRQSWLALSPSSAQQVTFWLDNP